MQRVDVSDLIGVPFVDGGRDPRQGLDCWGLAVEVYRRFGVSLCDYAAAAFDLAAIDDLVERERRNWEPVRMSEEAVPCLIVIRFNSGDLCNHTGVHLGGWRFIHTRALIGANIDRIDSPQWATRVDGFYRPLPGAIQC